ncbi:hypothetical protein APX01_21725 (plasmid) [Cereibacter sphaeroides]|nr:hypothetical protein APX01_21725 [Cereibacter sphaeroides]
MRGRWLVCSLWPRERGDAVTCRCGQGAKQSEPGPEFADQVRSVLLSNPEVVLEVFALLERQEKEKQTAGARAAVEAEAAALFQGADARKAMPARRSSP